MDEAKYKGNDVELNKPKRGDVKKFKVFVKDPKTKNVKKVNFGDKNMEIKRDDPERKKAFRARHNCDDANDKTTPKYWSCKMWSNKNVKDILNEILDNINIDDDKFKIKNELNQKIWVDDKLNPEIRKILLKNAIEFLKYSELNKLNINDIIITGSIANYNWTDESDVDLHILMDVSQISDDSDLVNDYLKLQKNRWNDLINPKLFNHDIEIYVQDINEPHQSTGVYSLFNDNWQKKPIKQLITIDRDIIEKKANDIVNIIE
jgi:predicted nuclease of predicted toxin-antitoxin system